MSSSYAAVAISLNVVAADQKQVTLQLPEERLVVGSLINIACSTKGGLRPLMRHKTSPSTDQSKDQLDKIFPRHWAYL